MHTVYAWRHPALLFAYCDAHRSVRLLRHVDFDRLACAGHSNIDAPL